MHDIREAVEKTVLKWPSVNKKMMFGSPAYIIGTTCFAMMVTGGIILTRLTEQEKTRLLQDPRAGDFKGHGRVMKKTGPDIGLFTIRNH
jgi:hypothetical protein